MSATSAASADKNDKVWYFEWLRVAACMAVVLIHCFATVLDNASVTEVGTARALGWTETLVFLGRWAVPVFLMITGALLLNRDKDIGYRKSFNYAKRIAIVLAIFGTLYALMELVFLARGIEVSMISLAVLNVFQEQSWAHLWYLYDLLGIYLLLPPMKAFVNKVERRDLEYALGILFVFALVVPTLNGATTWEVKNLIWLGSSVFYFLLGHYLHTCVDLTPRLGAGACVGVLTAAIVAGGGITMLGDYCRWAWLPSSPFEAAWASGIFLFAKKHALRPMKQGGFLELISSLSFGIYVVHPIFTNGLYKAIHWASAPLPPVVFEVTTFLIVFFAAFALAFVIKRIPLIGRYM